MGLNTSNVMVQLFFNPTKEELEESLNTSNVMVQLCFTLLPTVWSLVFKYI